jgi:hypothetical protein
MAAGYLFISGRTFYAELVAGKVGEALEQSGYELKIGALRGNPITGVFCNGAVISSGGAPIATVDEIGLYLSLPTILSKTPRLAKIDILGLDLDYETAASHMPKPKSDQGASPPVDRLSIYDSSVKTPWGTLGIDALSTALGAANYNVELRGNFRGKPLYMNTDILTSSGGIRIDELEMKLDKTSVNAQGEITPSLDVLCALREFDMGTVYEIIPQAESSTVRGVYSGELHLFNSSDIEIDGTISSAGGGIWLFPFNKMTATIHYTDGSIEVKDIAADIFGGGISGIAGIKLPKGKKTELDLKLGMKSIDTRMMTSVMPWLESFSGVIDSASCDIKGPLNSLSGRARLKSASFDVAGYDISNIDATIGVSGSSSLAIALDGISYNSPLSCDASVSLTPDIKINAQLHLPKVSLDALAAKYPQVKKFGARGDGSVNIKIGGHPSALTISGALSLPKLDIGSEYSLGDAKAEFELAHEILSVKNAAARWNNALITAEGSSNLSKSASGQPLAFNGKVSNFNISAIGGMVNAVKENNIGGVVSGTWTLGGTSDNPVFSADASVPRLSIGKTLILNGFSVRGGYKSSELTISKTAFKLGNADITAAGSVSPATDERPLMYDIKGSFKNLDPADLVRMGLISEDISGDLAGDARIWSGGGEPSYRVFFKDSRIRYSNTLDISDIKGLVTLSGGNLLIENLRTNMNMGYISLNGKIENVMSKTLNKMPINISASVASADAGRISRIFNPMAKGFQGMVSGSADIRGSVASPSFTASARVSAVRAFGLFLPVVWLNNIHGSMRDIEFPEIRAIVGRGVINADGELSVKSGDFSGRVRARGNNVDIRSLTFSLDEDTRRAITGLLDFDFEGSGGPGSFIGRGKATIPALSVRGVTLTDIEAPFLVTDGFILIEESSAKAYGGSVNAQMAKDLNLSDWGGRFQVESADMASAFRDIMPNSEGVISGVTNFTMRFSGDTRRTSMQDGNGSIEVLDGEISGFDGAKAVSKLVRGKPLRFRSALFSFNIDGKTIYLLPGSRVSAPGEDPIFKYVMVDGSVALDNHINLSCVGNVNIRALNAFAAGMQGMLSAAIDGGTTNDMLQNFLGSAITGFSRNEFRDVSLKVSGIPGDIKFSDVTVANPVKFDAMPAGLAEPEGAREKDAERINIKLEFPVGPGGNSRSDDSIGGQVGGQVLEQALKGLLTF